MSGGADPPRSDRDRLRRARLPVRTPPAGDRPVSRLDIARLREDTGFEPQYDTAAAAADYIAWLRAGNQR